jgi:hypothetical protein
MTWLTKIAVQAFDDEMQKLLQGEGVDKIMDSRTLGDSEDLTPTMNNPRSVSKVRPVVSNVGATDYYCPVESEDSYSQTV